VACSDHMASQGQRENMNAASRGGRTHCLLLRASVLGSWSLWPLVGVSGQLAAGALGLCNPCLQPAWTIISSVNSSVPVATPLGLPLTLGWQVAPLGTCTQVSTQVGH
jgi:hypothetical protein